MIVALYILLVMIVVGAVLYIFHSRDIAAGPAPESGEGSPAETSDAGADGEVCCGMHVTCEKDSLLATVSKEIEYYDDEELDRFRGRGSDEYTDDEIEEFRNVLLTLLPGDIAGWGRSIQLRGITLPDPVRQELLLIVSEARAALHPQKP